MKGKTPDYCKGCSSLHSAGRNHRDKKFSALKRYNAWCCAKGSPADEAVGWCKVHGKRKVRSEMTEVDV